MNATGLMLRLPPELKKWLADVAKKDDRSMNSQAVKILKGAMAQAGGLNAEH